MNKYNKYVDMYVFGLLPVLAFSHYVDANYKMAMLMSFASGMFTVIMAGKLGRYLIEKKVKAMRWENQSPVKYN